MPKSKIKIIAGLLLVFFLGVLTGSLGTEIYIREKIDKFARGGSKFKRTLAMKRLTRQLDLTPSQQVEIAKIVDQSLKELHEFKKKNHPEIERIFDQAISKIKEKLNAEQKKTMDRISKQLKKRWHHPPPPRDHPPPFM